jgi:hypothetical protein
MNFKFDANLAPDPDPPFDFNADPVSDTSFYSEADPDPASQ